MILFRKYYKAANDDIETNRELIDQIFAKASVNKIAKKSKIYSFGMRYGTAFAAVFVLCVAIAVYPKITNLNQEPAIIEYSESLNESTPKEDNYKHSMDNEEASNEAKKITKSKSKSTIVMPQSKNDVDTKIAESGQENQNITIVSETEEQNSRAKVITNCQADISALETATENDIISATNILEEKFGSVDKDTGNLYSFEIVGKFEYNESVYYLGRWRWFVDDHSSLICEFILSNNLDSFYECYIVDNIASWNSDANMFK